MDFRQALRLLVAAVVFAMALSVAQTSLLAAACLAQYSILTALEYDSKTFRSVIDGYERELSVVKVLLLIVALLLIL